MADNTITGANSVVMISVPGLFPTPIQLQGYSAERAWSTDSVSNAETQMGVDGTFTAGWVPAPVKLTYSLLANSISKILFNTIYAAEQAAKEKYYINATVYLPSAGETFDLNNGVLTDFKPMPDFSKVLQPMDFAITWGSVVNSLV